MTSATNRRAVLGAMLAAGATGATAVLPAAAASSEPQLSTDDLDVLQLWHERTQMKVIAARVYAEYDAVYDKQQPGDHALGFRCDAATNAVADIESKVDGYIGKSVQALGAFLAMEINDEREDDEAFPGLYRAMLAAIRPQLVGAIAEDADRVLAQGEEAA